MLHIIIACDYLIMCTHRYYSLKYPWCNCSVMLYHSLFVDLYCFVLICDGLLYHSVLNHFRTPQVAQGVWCEILRKYKLQPLLQFEIQMEKI